LLAKIAVILSEALRFNVVEEWTSKVIHDSTLSMVMSDDIPQEILDQFQLRGSCYKLVFNIELSSSQKVIRWLDLIHNYRNLSNCERKVGKQEGDKDGWKNWVAIDSWALFPSDQ
jgi:hypothetical protein